MKKSLIFGAMASMMLFATSCQEDFPVVETGNEAVVSFNLTTPQIATRAYSDGLTANQLQYAVYKVNNDNSLQLLENLGVGVKDDARLTLEDRKKEINLKLTTGDTYTVVFWAHAPKTDKTPYTVHFDATEAYMTVDYAVAKTLSNDETRDAFFNDTTFTVTGSVAMEVDLRRPFAQLNIGTSDWEDAQKSGYEVNQTAVTVPQVYTRLNLVENADFTHSVSDPVEVTFGLNNIPTGEDFPVEPATYKYLSMNYLLVRDDKDVLPQVTLTYNSTDGNSKTRTFGQIPVQRNYRTNIYGQLLTSNVDVYVEIIPEYYEPDFNEPQEGPVVVKAVGTDYENGKALIEAINKCANGGTVYVEKGTYALDRNNARINDKDFTLIGEEGVVIRSDEYGLVLQGNNVSQTTQVTLKDVKIQGGYNTTRNLGHQIYAKGNINVDLYNCVLENLAASDPVSILVSTGDPVSGQFVEGLAATVNAYNVTVEDNATVELLAWPNTQYSNHDTSISTYAKFNFEGGNISTIKPQGSYNTGSDNLIVNGVALNPGSKAVVASDINALTSAISASKDGDVIFVAAGEYTPTKETYLTKAISLVALGDVVMKNHTKANFGVFMPQVNANKTIVIDGFKFLFDQNSCQAIMTAYGSTGSVVVKNCTFEGTRSGWSYVGDAIYKNPGMYMDIKDCTFTNHRRAIINDGVWAELDITGCTFSGITTILNTVLGEGVTKNEVLTYLQEHNTGINNITTR